MKWLTEDVSASFYKIFGVFVWHKWYPQKRIIFLEAITKWYELVSEESKQFCMVIGVSVGSLEPLRNPGIF